MFSFKITNFFLLKWLLDDLLMNMFTGTVEYKRSIEHPRR